MTAPRANRRAIKLSPTDEGTLLEFMRVMSDSKVRAMVLRQTGIPLVEETRPLPKPDSGEVVVRVEACGVCRTDLHLVDGELPKPNLPIVPGHEIVGRVVAQGENVQTVQVGDRVGIPWLGRTCGNCRFCRTDRENLCENPEFTGYTRDGGFATHTIADSRFCFPISEEYDAAEAAPLLCAGLIGWRAYQMCGERARRIGLYGFGAAAHILCQVATWQDREIYAFTRPGDEKGQEFARQLGATWAGGSDAAPPQLLDAAILFAPVGELVPKALADVDKGGAVVAGGIHMSDIPSFPYRLLWEERVLRSVANLTREDGESFLRIAPQVPVRTRVTRYPLEQANQALEDLRNGRFEGAAVLVMESG